MASTGHAGAAIRAEGLTKRFGTVHALRGIDLWAEPGSVLALLGPNGAGKTTVVRILTTLLQPDAGTAVVAGFDVVRDAAAVRSRIGLAGQQAAVDEYLTGHANLEMVGRLYHLAPAAARARASELLERFGLADAGRRLVKTYSGGMRRRLDLAASLVNGPPIVFLDEPTTGLDPRSRNAMWHEVTAMVAAGTTVLLTTQYLEEADRLADRIAVLDAGRVVATGAPEELKRRVGGERVAVRVRAEAALPAARGAIARAVGLEPSLDPASGQLTVAVPSGARALAAIVRELDAAGVAVEDIALRRPTLDEAFFKLTGRGEAESEAGGPSREAVS